MLRLILVNRYCRYFFDRRLGTDVIFSYEKIRQLMLEFAYSNLI